MDATNIQTKNQTTKRLILYLIITFGITYLVDFVLIYPFVKSISIGMQTLGQLLISFTMFIPAIGVLLTRLLTKEGFRNAYIVPNNWKRSIPYFLFGWFGPVILTVLGAIVYFLVFPDKFDSDMGYMAAAIAASGVEPTKELLWISVISQLVTGILLAPLLNAFTCFGEEWGWIVALTAALCLVFLGIYAYRLMKNADSTFDLIAVGAAFVMIIFQSALNIFGSVDLLPLTGVTFVFVSRGGTSLISAWLMMAFFKSAELHHKEPTQWRNAE